MIRIGGTYRFVQVDCAGEHVPGMDGLRGATVRVLDTVDCLSCWKVRCIRTGRELQVFSDELQEIIGPMSCDGPALNVGLGECIVAMFNTGAVTVGREYRVSSLNADGTVDVSEYNRASNEFSALPGRYHTGCFRRK